MDWRRFSLSPSQRERAGVRGLFLWDIRGSIRESFGGFSPWPGERWGGKERRVRVSKRSRPNQGFIDPRILRTHFLARLVHYYAGNSSEISRERKCAQEAKHVPAPEHHPCRKNHGA